MCGRAVMCVRVYCMYGVMCIRAAYCVLGRCTVAKVVYGDVLYVRAL